MKGWRKFFLIAAGILSGLVLQPASIRAQDCVAGHIVVSEFLPDPASGNENEFVEVANIGSDAVDVSGWWIDDIEKGSNPKVIPASTILAPGSFFVMEFTGSVLNNGEDSVRILMPDKTTEIFCYSYTESTKGQSYNRLDDGTYTLSSTLTPGAANAVVSASPSPAATPVPAGIVISEFLPAPLADGPVTQEFIELTNIGSESVAIGGWKLDDSTEVISSKQIIPPGTTIAPGEFFVLYLTSNILNNDGEDAVRLLGPDNAPIDVAHYSGSAPGRSYQRQSDGIFITGALLTPGQANPVPAAPAPSPIYNPAAVIINEFLVNPSGNESTDEFIELKNISEDGIDITGWKLGDGASRVFTFPVTPIVSPGEIIVRYRSVTKIALNNSGDTVRLLTPTGEKASAFTYRGSAGNNQSYNYEGAEQYAISTTATPGKPNIITAPPAPTPRAAIVKAKTATRTTAKSSPAPAAVKLADVRKQSSGKIFVTQGVVSAFPGVLGKQIFYVAGSGIQVYLHSAKFPRLALGDTVQLTGELTSNRGEARLKISRAGDIIVKAHGPEPAAHPVEMAAIGEEYEGFLVTVTGTATSVTKDGLVLADGDIEVRVVFQEGANIAKPALKRGQLVSVTGIVSQTTSGYRILPRQDSDIQVGGPVSVGRVSGATTGTLTRFPKTGGGINMNTVRLAIMGALVSSGLLSWGRQAQEPLLRFRKDKIKA